jgi:metallo-beta-lactamase class B
MVLFLCVCSALAQRKATSCSQCAVWNRPQKPFRIYGNTYYVGPHGLSSILITSPAGHIVIDGALPESAPQIVSNIQALGFRIQDVKVILNSHVHLDHAGGLAELQRRSGARILAGKWSAAVLEHGGVARDDPQFGELRPILPLRNVHGIADGETVRVGDVSITMHLTPGHTPGGLSWTWKSCEADVCRAMVYADSLAPVSAARFRFSDSSRYPQVVQDFEKSFSFLESTPCDVLVTPHPESSELWDRLEARERGVKPDPMVNPNACKQLAEHGRELLQRRLAQERNK